MGRYITTKADFTLRRKHKKGSGVTIYETDYTTINPMPNAMKGEYVIGDSNFVFTSRLGINTQRKHVRGKFVQPPLNGSSDETVPWTIDNMAISSITTETRIRLKPDYNSIKDFACYGSAEKLIQGTVNGVITDFPAEMYLGKSDLDKFSLYNWDAGYGLDETRGGKQEFMTFYNEYGIDITTVNVLPESVTNPLRYLTLCGTSYTYIVDGQEPIELTSFSVFGTSSGYCYNGKDVWIDKLAEVELKFGNSVTVHVYVFKDNRTKEIFYGYSGGEPGAHIRPKKEIVEDYFMNCDDFTAVLLDRVNKPIYTATFETPRETDTGIIYDMVTYTWPSLLGGYNPDLSGPYYSYLESLMHLGEFLDEYYTDNMWRSLTHEAIKALDWTYVSNSDGEIEDLSKIDTSRIEPITKIYGRQFDDLKRYADGIKSINTITYNQRANTPDYTLTDVLANSGWEIKTLKLSSDNELATESLYPGLTSGYTASDANNEFFRRLKLNSNYLFSAKGTRKGIDTILALLGLRPEEYKISEYVGVFSGNKDRYKHFCDKTEGKEQSDDCPDYPLAEDVATINRYKANFNSYDPYGAYCGIPVTEIGYWKGDEDFSYVVPWYSHGKTYDDGLYFQMNGGWGKREDIDINLDIAPNILTISGDNLYTETQARLKFAKNLDELLQQAHVSSNLNDVFYVTDLSDIETAYSIGWKDENLSAASHYFILENEKYNQFLGYSDEAGEYGWRSIEMSEITEPSTAGTLVLYMESIIDDTTGNNPHVGNGTYDDGMSYVSGMSEIFAYSILNKNFIGIDDETCDKIKDYYFDVEFHEDNRKSWFFSDNYNNSCGKTDKCDESECEEKIEFREADVTDDVCDVKKTYEITEVLTEENTSVPIGAYADNSFSNTEEVWYKVNYDKELLPVDYSIEYNRLTYLDPFNPEGGKENEEAAANSVVNLKNMEIEFYYPYCLSDSILWPGYKDYIENVVMFYLMQFIPSTTIFSYKITGKNYSDDEKKRYDCDGYEWNDSKRGGGGSDDDNDTGYLSVNPKKLTFVNKDTSEKNVTVEAYRQGWTIKSFPSWLIVQPEEGPEGKTKLKVKINPEEPADESERSGNIVITGDKYDSVSVDVVQLGSESGQPVSYNVVIKRIDGKSTADCPPSDFAAYLEVYSSKRQTPATLISTTNVTADEHCHWWWNRNDASPACRKQEARTTGEVIGTGENAKFHIERIPDAPSKTACPLDSWCATYENHELGIKKVACFNVSFSRCPKNRS